MTLGDIRFISHLLQGKAAPTILEKRKGWEINLFDLLFIRQGVHEDIEGRIYNRTTGRGIQLSGLFKLMRWIDLNVAHIGILCLPGFKLLFEHFDVRYHYAKYDAGTGHPMNETLFQGINVVIY